MAVLSKILQCPICKTEFMKTHWRKKYCGRACAQAADYQRHKDIYNKRRKVSYSKNKEKEKARSTIWCRANKEACRNHRLKSVYGLTISKYNEMSIKQNNVCYICGGINLGGKGLYIDHNHQTGKVRKLLCSRCNWYVGLMETDYKLFKEVARYIEEQNNE